MDTKISAMTAASALTGAELVAGVQSGANVKITTAQIATLSDTGVALLASANVFTALQTITLGAVNTGVLASSGYSLTGSDQTSMVNLTGTWNTSGAPSAIFLNVTDTASSGSSLLMRLQVGGLDRFRVFKNGTIEAAATIVADGSLSAGSDVTAGNSGVVGWNDAFTTRVAAASIKFGAADAASPVAQTVGVQGVVGGTTNTAGANWTIKGSVGTGTGAGGQIILQTAPAGSTGSTQNAFATALTITAPAVSMQPSVVVGNQALATTATDGFLYIPTCAGTPTGVPTTFTGRIAMVYDTSAHQFWFFDGSWKQPKTPAAAAIITWQ